MQYGRFGETSSVVETVTCSSLHSSSCRRPISTDRRMSSLLPSRLDESCRRPLSLRSCSFGRTLKTGKLVEEAALDSKLDEPFDLRSDEITR